MDFELTTEQTMFKDMAKEFAIREVQPYVKQWDRDCRTPPRYTRRWGSSVFWESTRPKNMAVSLSVG